MVNTFEKKVDTTVNHGAVQNTAAACYICGSRHDTNKELCPACVRIISVGLKLVCVDRTTVHE